MSKKPKKTPELSEKDKIFIEYSDKSITLANAIVQRNMLVEIIEDLEENLSALNLKFQALDKKEE